MGAEGLRSTSNCVFCFVFFYEGVFNVYWGEGFGTVWELRFWGYWSAWRRNMSKWWVRRAKALKGHEACGNETECMQNEILWVIQFLMTDADT